MQIMALAELGQLEEAVKTMEDGLRDTASSSSRTCTVYSDTVSTRHSFISCRKFVLMDLQQGSELCVQTGFTNLHCLRQHCILFSGSVCCSLGKTDLFSLTLLLYAAMKMCMEYHVGVHAFILVFQ